MVAERGIESTCKHVPTALVIILYTTVHVLTNLRVQVNKVYNNTEIIDVVGTLLYMCMGLLRVVAFIPSIHVHKRYREATASR